MSRHSIDDGNVPSIASSPTKTPPREFVFPDDDNVQNEFQLDSVTANNVADALPPLNINKVNVMTQTDKYEMSTQTCKFIDL